MIDSGRERGNLPSDEAGRVEPRLLSMARISERRKVLGVCRRESEIRQKYYYTKRHGGQGRAVTLLSGNGPMTLPVLSKLSVLSKNDRGVENIRNFHSMTATLTTSMLLH